MTASRLWVGVALTSLLSACAATEPFPPAPAEVLVVVNGTAKTLTVVPTAAASTPMTISLGSASAVPEGIAAAGGIALVPLGDDDAVAVVDLANNAVLHAWPLAAGSGATGAAIVDDSIGFVAEPKLGRVVRLNYLTGDTISLAVGVRPLRVVFTRGKVFVINSNTDSGGTALGAGWITVVDPTTIALATGIDSIPLPLPGNARTATVGADGLLYVMSAGDSGSGVGRLAIVNPVTREEVGDFPGFGNLPGDLTTEGEVLFVSSWAEGVMTFDTRLRQVTRGAGEGAPVATNSSIIAGARGLLYAISAGPCTGGTGGVAHILRATDLAPKGTIPLGECARGAIITTVPAP